MAHTQATSDTPDFHPAARVESEISSRSKDEADQGGGWSWLRSGGTASYFGSGAIRFNDRPASGKQLRNLIGYGRKLSPYVELFVEFFALHFKLCSCDP